jgi:hypothetical protein
MRRQTLRKPRSSTCHDHRSSTFIDAIQKPKKTFIPVAARLSLSFSLSLSMILTTQLQKGLSKAAPREPKRPSSIQCHEERERKGKQPRQAPFASDSSNISPLPPLPPLPKTESYTDQIISHPKATASWSMIPQPRGGTPTAALPIRSDYTLKIP